MRTINTSSQLNYYADFAFLSNKTTTIELKIVSNNISTQNLKIDVIDLMTDNTRIK